MSETPTGGSLREWVAEEVRSRLARKRMSGTQLAKRMGVSQAYIWRRLSGETALDLDDIERIGEILDLEPVELLPRVANLTGRSNLYYSAQTVRPPDRRPKGRADSRTTARPKDPRAERRTKVKRVFTPEELSVIAA